MNMDLAFMTFIANLRDMSQTDNDTLSKVLEKIPAEYWLDYIFYYAVFDKTDMDKSIKYYTDLIDQVVSLSDENTFTDNQVQLYKGFVQIYHNIDNEDFDISPIENIITLEFTTVPDKYMQYMVSYNVLLWYSNRIFGNPSYLPRMRELTQYLTDHETEYSNLSAEVDKVLRNKQ